MSGEGEGPAGEEAAAHPRSAAWHANPNPNPNPNPNQLTPGLQRGERALQLALERRDLRVDCLVNLHLVGVRAGVWGRG